MKSLNRIIYSILLVFLSFSSTTSCSFNFLHGDIYYAKLKSEEVLQCLDEDDSEGLKKLFCAKTQSLSDFDQQIEDVIDFCQGKIVSYEKISSGNGGKSIDAGVTTKYDITPQINSIKTDAGEKYEIGFSYYIIYEEHKDRVGINIFRITAEDGSRIVIGDVSG